MRTALARKLFVLASKICLYIAFAVTFEYASRESVALRHDCSACITQRRHFKLRHIFTMHTQRQQLFIDSVQNVQHIQIAYTVVANLAVEPQLTSIITLMHNPHGLRTLLASSMHGKGRAVYILTANAMRIIYHRDAWRPERSGMIVRVG